VVVPPSPGTFCSLGLLVTDVKSDFVLSTLIEGSSGNMEFVEKQFKELKEEGIRLLEKENIPEEQRDFELVIDVRFKGQNYEIPISVEWDELSSDGYEVISNRFHEQHEKSYGYANKEGIVEFVNYRLTAVGKLPKAKFKKSDLTTEDVLPSAERLVYYSETNEPGYYNTKIFTREDLRPGNKIQGPLIVEQMDSTILVLPKQTMNVDEYGNLIINTFGEEVDV